MPLIVPGSDELIVNLNDWFSGYKRVTQQSGKHGAFRVNGADRNMFNANKKVAIDWGQQRSNSNSHWLACCGPDESLHRHGYFITCNKGFRCLNESLLKVIDNYVGCLL